MKAILLLVLLLSSPLSAAPTDQIGSYSDFKSIDLKSLSAGEILTQRNPATSSSRILAVQSCFLIKKPVSEATARLMEWNPQPHAELNIQISKTFKPGEDSGLDSLALNQDGRPIQLLLQSTARAKEKTDHLQLSAAELQSLPGKADPGSPGFKKQASSFWSSVLKQRLALFLEKGLGALPSHTTGGIKLSVADEVQSALNAEPKIAREFSSLSREILSAGSPAPALCYWQLFKADTEATFCLGSFHSKAEGDKTQLIDLQFYVSGTYFTSITLYQLYPVSVDGKPQTLVWRADYVSAPSFNQIKGTEKMAASMLMLQDIKKSIALFQQDTRK